jgi:hypothetical protein
MPSQLVTGQLPTMPLACQDVAFSTEEDFVAFPDEPAGSIQIISDGDLLSFDTDINGNATRLLCARNHELLTVFGVPASVDLGLDAVDVVSAEGAVVVFSTSLDAPPDVQMPFTAGDLLVTNGAVILNTALTAGWSVGFDVGLDAVHLVGEPREILAFLDAAAGLQVPVDAGLLVELFSSFQVDIWFSTEGTYAPPTGLLGFLDGDVLSARSGSVVVKQADLPDPTVPAGLPQDGVDFGLDAVTADRRGLLQQLRFSTEVLYEDGVAFTDGDVLRYGNGVEIPNVDLIATYLPAVRELGLDALHLGVVIETGQIEGMKFYDVEELGVYEPGVDDPLGQWEIHLDGVDDLGFPISLATQTNASGVYSFTVASGVYTVSEVCPAAAAWIQTLPPSGDVKCGGGTYVVTVEPNGIYKDFDFGNTEGQSLYLPVVLRAVQP